MTTTETAWAIPQVSDRRFGAALFDLDGVLTPTAEVHMAAWKRMFTDYFTAHAVTPAYTDDDYFAYVDGKPRYDGVRACLASRGITLPEGDPTDAGGTATVCGLGNAKNDMFASVLREDGIAPYPGSVALIDHLNAAGVPMAVVSSSRNAPEVLAAAGLDHHFDVVVDGAVAARDKIPGKPAPDTYQRAAELLGVPQADAVVVEDAISGVQAGAAGDFGLVVGVDRGAGADALARHGADVVVADLAELVA
ncbi:MAG: HAD family hydrolase [Demequina sp.]|uniref:HAD family hydrolase n=1 Tax=Demequina sp. TaxID=2050685 RepID=UPI003A855370